MDRQPAAHPIAGESSTPSPGPWLSRRRRVGLAALFLVYLLYVAIDVAQYSHGAAEAVGYVVLGAFAAAYLLIADRSTLIGPWAFAALFALLCALMVAELPFARATGFTLCLYLTAAFVARAGERAWPLVVVLCLVSLLVPLAIPGWHDTFADSIDLVTPIAVPVIALMSIGVRQINAANVALAQARIEVARLSAEAERARIARDLHDLLGHSLTTITVKAGLAHRVSATDSERAFSEIAEVETLARRSLHEVRAAVAGYREVTLSGELATGRELLRAAGVSAEWGGWGQALDDIDPAHQELLGWVVREGLTNVVRHSRAGSCTVRVSRDGVEIVDDGVGAPQPANGGPLAGHGLAGLGERVASAGGTIEAGPCEPSGWRLRVRLPGAAT